MTLLGDAKTYPDRTCPSVLLYPYILLVRTKWGFVELAPMIIDEFVAAYFPVNIEEDMNIYWWTYQQIWCRFTVDCHGFVISMYRRLLEGTAAYKIVDSMSSTCWTVNSPDTPKYLSVWAMEAMGITWNCNVLLNNLHFPTLESKCCIFISS